MLLPQIRAATVATGSVDHPSGDWPLLNEAIFASTAAIAVEIDCWSAPTRSVTSSLRSESTTPPPSEANVLLLNTSSAETQNELTDAVSADDDLHPAVEAAQSTAAAKTLDTPCTYRIVPCPTTFCNDTLRSLGAIT
jgi:hypothetical protein